MRVYQRDGVAIQDYALVHRQNTHHWRGEFKFREHQCGSDGRAVDRATFPPPSDALVVVRVEVGEKKSA
jgi:hypothetical protein